MVGNAGKLQLKTHKIQRISSFIFLPCTTVCPVKLHIASLSKLGSETNELNRSVDDILFYDRQITRGNVKLSYTMRLCS